jgi:hypothetical protein
LKILHARSKLLRGSASLGQSAIIVAEDMCSCFVDASDHDNDSVSYGCRSISAAQLVNGAQDWRGRRCSAPLSPLESWPCQLSSPYFKESKVISPLSLRSCCVRWFSADMDAFVISCVGVSATAGRELASFSADTDFGNLLGGFCRGLNSQQFCTH